VVSVVRELNSGSSRVRRLGVTTSCLAVLRVSHCSEHYFLGYKRSKLSPPPNRSRLDPVYRSTLRCSEDRNEVQELRIESFEDPMVLRCGSGPSRYLED
jgi:hypothetical protein